MPRRLKALVLDTWSVIAYFEDEPAGQQGIDILSPEFGKDASGWLMEAA